MRPTREELSAAAGRTVPDVIASGLRVLFCGINPGLYSAAVGHHFARPGNRFWPALHASGFTDRLLSPSEEHELLGSGLGITNIAARATASAAELPADELRRGARILSDKLVATAPRVLAVLGVGAFRTGFGRRGARIGPQEEPMAGVRVWVLPNPSGLAAGYGLDAIVALLSELRSEIA